MGRARPRSRREPRRRSWASILRRTAILGLLVVVAIPATAAAPQHQADPSPVHPPRVRLVGHDSVIAATGAFTVFLDVSGVSAGTSLAVDIYPRIDSPTRLDDAIEADPRDSSATFDVIPIEVDATTTTHRTGFSIALGTPAQPRAPTAWTRNLTESGVYPVKIRLRDVDGATLHQIVTYLVRAPEGPSVASSVEPVEVALLFHLSEDMSRSQLPDDVSTEPALTPEVVNELAHLVDILDTRPELAATLLVEPDLAARITGENPAESPILDLAANLMSAHRELLGTTYVPVAADALVASDLSSELEHQIDLGNQVLAATLAEPAPPFYLPRAADDATLAALAGMGITQIVAAPGVFDDHPIRSHPGADLVSTHPSTSAVAIDEAFDLAEALSGNDAELAVTRTFAHLLALAHLPGADPARVLVRADLHEVDPDRLAQLLDRLEQVPELITPVTVSNLFAAIDESSPPPAGHTSDDPDNPGVDPDGINPREGLVLAPNRASNMGELASRLTGARRLASSYASMGFDEEVLWPLDRSLARSLDATRPTSSRLHLLELTEARIRDELATIALPDRERVTLGTRDAEFPLTIRSGLISSASVVVELDSSDRLNLPQERFDVTLSGERTTVQVPVQSLTTGDTPLRITVRTPDGEVMLAETTYAIRSTAVSGVGVVLTVGAGAFLIIWWGRHIWSHRRGRPGRHAA